MITGILLAAGRSSRFGSQKLLARLPNPDNRRVVEASALHLLAAVGRVIAITSRDDLLMRVLDDCGCQVAVNEHAHEGMGSSIAAGINESKDSAGWIITLGDMPYLKTETIVAVREQLVNHCSIVIPTYQGERGHPVGFAHQYGTLLGALQGDSGAKSIIEAAIAQDLASVIELTVKDAGVLADVDVPADLR